MNTYLDLITDRIGKISIIFGIAFLLVGLALSMVLIPGEAAEVNGQGNCDTGWVDKIEQPGPFVYNGPDTIVKVIVKSGKGCFPLTISSPSDGCYQATGLGTTSVSVTRIGTPGPECQAISHAEFYAGPTDPPVSETPVTETPVTETPVTETPVTETPVTETPVTETPVTETPPTTEAPVTTDPPTTTTPTEEVRTPTPPPTLPQPTAVSTSQVLIPQTGLDLTNPGDGTSFWLFLFMGLGLVGTGIVFHGVTKQIKRR